MNKRIVLLVEDNPNDVALTQRAFKQNNIAHELVVVRDGVEAMEYLKKAAAGGAGELPTVVLLDLKMPRMDGLELLRWIRANERLMRLPVVILTSSKEEVDIVKGYGRGANSYLCKPVSFEQFNEVVRELAVFWLAPKAAPPQDEAGG